MTVPLLTTLRRYRSDLFRADVVAGLTTAVMLVPQAMAYAMLAGLPPIVGLYASVVPLALYAFFGTSRELAVGPVAMVSLMVAAGVSALAPAGSPELVAMAITLSALVGVIQLSLGLLRAGFLVNFLSHPVISGFTSAAALIIGFSQLKHLMGIDLGRSHYIHSIAVEAVSKIADVNFVTFAIGIGSIAALLSLKRWRPLFPRSLAVVAVGSVITWSLDLTSRGVAVVGDVPAGLPGLALPSLDHALDLLPVAIAIALVGFMESISVAKAFARRARYEIEPNRELIGLGAANLGAAMTGAYPVAGGFGRSAVNAQAGARTPVASLITAAAVALSLLFFTPLFYYLPKAVLAASIMTAVIGLVDLAEIRHLWRVKRSDLVLLALTFAATLGLGIEPGIGVGIGASLLWFVIRSTRPHTAVLGRLADGEFRNIERYPEARPIPGALLIRMDASFYYGNVTFLRDTLRRLEDEYADGDELRAVILDFSAVNNLDSSADAALHDLHEDYRRRGIRLILGRVKGPVMDVLQRSGYTGEVTTSVAAAVDSLR